jgi:hypothetical protein
MSKDSFDEKSAGNRKRTLEQWLDHLNYDFGGWRGIGFGIGLLLCGVLLYRIPFGLVPGTIVLWITAILAVVDWFRGK